MKENREKRGSQLLFLFFFCERVLGCNWDLGFLRVFLCTIVFSLIIVKSLQFRGHRQIAESRKFCLVRVIIFLWRVFFLFVLFLTGWEFWLNSLQEGDRWGGGIDGGNVLGGRAGHILGCSGVSICVWFA